MVKLINILNLIFVAAFLFGCANNNLSESSPDGMLNIKVEIENGKLYYQLSRNGSPVLNKSQLGFVLKKNLLGEDLTITSVKHSYFNETWQPIWGEDSIVDNTYREMKISLEEKSSLNRKFDIVFRVFDDGIGFRYEFPEQKNLKDFVIMDELTEFALDGNHKAWYIPFGTQFYEGLYKTALVNSIGWVSTPLTMETTDGLYISIHEANLTNYAAMNLIPQNNSTVLKANLTPWSTGEKVFMKTPGVTPWRTIIVASNAGDLLLSRLMLNLNDPNKIEDCSWINPGRYIGIWWGMHMQKYSWHIGANHGATTQNTMRYIDFAAKYGFSGVLVEGWNKGWDTYNFNFTESYPDFDLEKVAKYAVDKNVMLIGHHETDGKIENYESQINKAFELYKKNGVNCIKTGYVGSFLNGKERHSSQFGVRHFRDVLELAVKHKIMINNHEPVMPTGLQRTYPNLMTQEGVRGQEWDAWSKDGGNPPNHTTIIPFTRGLAGPMDFTPGTFNFTNNALPGTRVQTTLAKQLALFVIIYSPLQMASDMIENYETNLELFDFITSCPTTWSKTLVPHAQIGEFLTISRKEINTGNWFVGSITNEESRELLLPLDFLDKKSKYKAKIFKDGIGASYKSDPYPVDTEELDVTSDSVLKLKLAPGGGTAIRIIKLK